MTKAVKPKSIPDGWDVRKLGEILKLNYGKGLPADNRIEGKYPVYGSNGVVGSHNQCLVKTEGIIVGRKGSAGLVHYSKNPFYPIDTTFYITQEDTSLHLPYLFYLLNYCKLSKIKGDVGVPGLNREMAYLEKVMYPPFFEQHNIAHILSKIQSAIETQKKIIQTTTELKKALMQKLFTEGLKGEPQKETEIGLAPESWEIKKLGDYATLITKGASPKWQGFNYCENGVMFIRSQNIGWGDVIKTGSTYLPETFNKTQKRSILKADDVLVNLVGASIGRVAVAPREFEGANINQAVALVRVKKESYPPKFIMYFLLTDMGQFLIKRQVKAIARGNISLEDVSNFFVPMPTISEQEEIVNTLTIIDEKHKFVIAKKQILINLFSSMLHHLMTGQIRVKDLRVS